MANTTWWIALLALVSSSLAAQDSTPDTRLSGKWTGTGSGGPVLLGDLPFSEAGRSTAAAYDHAEDQVLKCLIDFGRVTSVRFPAEIIVQDHQVTFLYEYGRQVRRIFLDRDDFSAPYPPSLMGYSIGRWEDGSLLVETRKLLPGWARMEGGGPYSDQTTVTERYTLDDSGKLLTVELTYDDPENYTGPWSYTHQYRPSEWDIFPYDCTVGSYGSEL